MIPVSCFAVAVPKVHMSRHFPLYIHIAQSRGHPLCHSVKNEECPPLRSAAHLASIDVSGSLHKMPDGVVLIQPMQKPP